VVTNISKKIELVANVAIIVVACLLGVTLVKNYLLPKKPERTVQAPPENRSVGNPTVSSLDIDWKKSKVTLLLVLSTQCHFCTESAPFYRELKKRDGVHIVAVLPQDLPESKKYLTQLGIGVDEVRQVSLPSIGVEGTPTLLLVDQEGAIKNTWRGKLSRLQESSVLDRLVAQ
jgi:hypothetical protein